MRLPLIGSLLDRRDDRRAQELRECLGRKGRLVSWHRDGPRPLSPWIARISCRDLPQTIEARGRTRRRAILAADEALARRIVQGPLKRSGELSDD